MVSKEGESDTLSDFQAPAVRETEKQVSNAAKTVISQAARIIDSIGLDIEHIDPETEPRDMYAELDAMLQTPNEEELRSQARISDTPERRKKHIETMALLGSALDLMSRAKKEWCNANFKPNGFADVCKLLEAKRKDKETDAKIRKVTGGGQTFDVTAAMSDDD